MILSGASLNATSPHGFDSIHFYRALAVNRTLAVECHSFTQEVPVMGIAVTPRLLYLLAHLGLGALYLHSFIEGVRGLLRPEHVRRLVYGVATMSALAWLTVISGTWLIYPGYRAKPVEGADLLNYPQAYLVAHEQIAFWHEFGMEWKEHAGWLAPILTTAVAYVVLRYADQLPEDARLRRALLGMFAIAFFAAFVSGTLGVLINKVAPNLFLTLS
jgi:hypothetical protein